jgi:dienelactone hydrolase
MKRKQRRAAGWRSSADQVSGPGIQDMLADAKGGSMRCTVPLTTAALALALPFILSHCASVPGPLTYDAKSVGGPNSGAPMELWLPPGPGPFPAVVVMHGCNGINSNHRGWAGRLREWGYAVALLDSFLPRNANMTCYNFRSNPEPILRAQDAFNAAIYLRTLSIIQPDHIGLIGFSHGGSTAVFAALASGVPTDRGGRPFQAVVAYYPWCRSERWPVEPARDKVLGEPASDLLILIGKDDDWTLASICREYLKAQAGFPHAPMLKEYPGAVHAFDSVFNLQFFMGHLVGTNSEARDDSYVMTKAFFDARLKSK